MPTTATHSIKKGRFKPTKEKSWTMKVNDPKKAPEVKKLEFDYSDMHRGDKMLIATPKIVDEYIRQIPMGKGVSMNTLRKDLAQNYRADNTCPLTTGIFLRIVCEAAYDAWEGGKEIQEITPFWRVVETRSMINKKLSFGADFVAQQRKNEGMDL